MKNLKCIAIASVTAILFSCGGQKKTEDKTKEQDTATNELTGKVPLKDVKLDSLGVSVGLPDGWKVDGPSEVNGEISYRIYQGVTSIMFITSSKKELSSPESIIENYAGYGILSEEKTVSENGLVRSGFVVCDSNNTIESQKKYPEYYYGYSFRAFRSLEVHISENYDSRALDTCYSIAKSIKKIN